MLWAVSQVDTMLHGSCICMQAVVTAFCNLQSHCLLMLWQRLNASRAQLWLMEVI